MQVLLLSVQKLARSTKNYHRSFLGKSFAVTLFLLVLFFTLFHESTKDSEFSSLIRKKILTFSQSSTQEQLPNPDLSPEHKTLLDKLHFWESYARILSSENEKLKELLHIQTKKCKTLHVPVLSFFPTFGSLGTSLILCAGKEDGISFRDPVVLGNQVLGQISGLGNSYACVMSIQSQQSCVPVITEGERLHGMAIGSGKRNLTLELRNPYGSVASGEIAFTSGIGGIYPPGLEVGRLQYLSDERIELEASIQLDQLEYVEVIPHTTPRSYKTWGV